MVKLDLPLRVLQRGFVLLFILILCRTSQAQLFIGQGGSIPDNDSVFTEFAIEVDSLTYPRLDGNFGIKEIHLDINHSYLQNLVAYVMSPDGSIVRLFTNIGGNGKNMLGTILTDTAHQNLATAFSPPYTGVYKPQETIGNFNNFQSSKGIWRLYIKDDGLYNTGNLIQWGLVFGNHPTLPDSFSSNLPILQINTFNELIDSVVKKNATLKIFNNLNGRNGLRDSSIEYQGNIDIQIRGKASSFFPQPSYGISLYTNQFEDTSLPLLGMPKGQDWILLGTYNDKSFLRNTLMFKLFSEMGHYATRAKHVEVFINGLYQGVFVFLEKIRRDPERLNLSALTENDISGEPLTGSYIFKHDYIGPLGWNSGVGPPECPNNVANFQFEYPSYKKILMPQFLYLKKKVEELESILFSPFYKDSINGYRSKIDIASFADFFICNEFAWNGDGFAKSMFFYKDRDSINPKIFAGPIWDFDWALKKMVWVPPALDVWVHTTYPCNNLQSTLPWHFILMQDPFFQQYVRCRWEGFRKTILSENYLHHYIDSVHQHLKEAEVRHYALWKTWGVNVGTAELPPFTNSYQEELDTLKALIHRRLQWLDVSLPGQCGSVPIVEDDPNEEVDLQVEVYPSPTSSMLNVVGDSVIKQYIILNAIGQRMEVKEMEGNGQKAFTLFFDNTYPPGNYWLIAFMENKRYIKRFTLQQQR